MKTFNIYIDSRHKWVRVAPQLDQNDVIWAYHASICKDLETDTFYLIDCYPIPESDMQDGKLTVADDVVFDRNLLRTLFQDYLSVDGALEINENVVEMLCNALNMTREEYEEGMFDNIPRLESLPNLDPLNTQFIIVGYGEEDNSTDKNKVLRTIATGQSDITRHEAYTKVTGLNESNGLVPTYINKEQTLNQMLQIVKRSVPEATQIVLKLPNTLLINNIYNTTTAHLAVAFPGNYIRQIVSDKVCPEGASTANFNTIPVTHSVNPESQYKEVRDFEYVIPTKYTENSGVISSTGSAYNSYAVVSEEDLIALLDLLNDLSNTNMDLYFGTTGK